MKHNIDRAISRDEFEHYIDLWCLNEQYRKILKRRFLDGIKFETLAEEFDMSVRHIKRIVYKHGDMVLNHI